VSVSVSVSVSQCPWKQSVSLRRMVVAVAEEMLRSKEEMLGHDGK
jgi:hypothetical protein